MSSLLITTSAGATIDLATYGTVQLGDRQRDYAVRQFRAVEGQRWGVAGDRRENPGAITLRLYLAPELDTRASQRAVIEALRGQLMQATAFINIPDAKTEALDGGYIALESPTYDPHESFVLELVLLPTGGADLAAEWIPDDGDY